ncbi:MAG: hypothetical protein HKO57_09910 [Akkermansiaceae bacterium]|nr:hypothetical protein [Akkermansiaceae bacterium]
MPPAEGAGTVVFNGDTCEQSYGPWRPGAEAHHEALRALCGDLGVRPVFLTGNHDPRISELGWLDLGEVFISHGDMIFPTSAPWSWEYIRNKERVHAILRARDDGGGGDDLAHRYETVQELHAAMVPEAGPRRRTTDGGKYLLSALWPPERSLNMLRVWATMAGRAERFVARYRPQCRVFLFGHFHRPGTWKRGPRLHVNTGSFMAAMPATVAEIDSSRLTVRRVEERGGEFRAGGVRAERARGGPQESRNA